MCRITAIHSNNAALLPIHIKNVAHELLTRTLLTAVRPVHVAVEDASLARLALAGPNGTRLSYDVSLAVSVHNRNWAMRAVLGADAPLDAELFFAGEHFARVRIQGSSRRCICPGNTEVYNVVAAGEGTAPLRSAGVATLVKESVAGGGFRLELKLAGEVRYPPHRTRRLEATCPLKLPLASPAGQARFKKVECVV
ncbi:hypothetical protein CFC21_092054 [Triticum aestivum]|uniref:Late embryogenesis abundant protein LEA-2 subgroup domain-containing protein n=2 Tax=Triticum aestivum TaxID=4565 RepID=A0A3B6QF31_WHEAT|nr:hypothetical protein CFC21_092054 [Triticum aestivum]